MGEAQVGTALPNFTQTALPYAQDALADKGISASTLSYHYGKHHAGYVAALNTIPEAAGKTVLELLTSSSGKTFNMAAQVWNHEFYWNSLSPSGGGDPTGALRTAIESAFTSVDNMRKKFNTTAAGHFGSGWVWLGKKSDGTVGVVDTHDAGNPLVGSQGTPLLVCDVWEHAYYLDTKNDRGAYLKNFWNAVNWNFAATNWAATPAPTAAPAATTPPTTTTTTTIN